MTTINPVFSLTAEDLALLGDEQFEKLCGAVDRLTQLLAADKQRRRGEASSGYDVLGGEATATCLRHRRLVRWLPAPGWWTHSDDLPGKNESCSGMWDLPAPIVIVRLAAATPH